MKHYVLTRSAYGPAWDIESNARRLAVTRAVTVPSMAAQTDRDWTWLVAIDRNDPLKADRKAAFRSSGVTVRFLEVTTSGNRDDIAFELYRADWNKLIGARSEAVSMTRIDDDDALAPWMMARVRKFGTPERRTAIVYAMGVRVWKGCFTVVQHKSNAMHTLITPPGDEMHVYGYKHREVHKHAHVHLDKKDIAWVWARHPDTISGWHTADPHAVSASLRAMFPIDWSIFGDPDPRGARGRSGRCFR